MAGNTMPIETVIIRSDATATETLVLKVAPTIAKHNVMKEVLKHIKQEFPGVWLEFLASQVKQQVVNEAKAEVKKA